MERAALVGASIGIQHPTTTRYSVDVEGLDAYMRQLGRSFDTLLPAAENLGFVIHDWVDKSEPSLQWVVTAIEKLKESGPPPLGTHLLMGDTARKKFENNIRNLREGRYVVYQARAEKQ